MGNCKKYQQAIAKYRTTVITNGERKDRDLARIAGYEGAKAEQDREEIVRRFKSAVSAARDEAWSEIRPVLERMRDKAESYGEVMEAPTAEQVNLLSMLSLRTSISPTEAASAAKALSGNDAAIATLSDLCRERGGAIVGAIHGEKSKRGRAYDAYKAFEDAAGMFLSWEGGDRQTLMRRRQVERRDHVPQEQRTSIGAAVSADVAAEALPEYDFVKVVLGNAADYNSSSLID